MDKDLRVFRELVLWLLRSNGNPGDYSDPKASEIINTTPMLLNGAFGKVEELELYLPSEEKVRNAFGPYRYLLLSPVMKDSVMVPRLQIHCDFGRNVPEVRCYLYLHLLYEVGPGQKAPRSLGFRFDPPEGIKQEEQGNHHYYHVQMVRTQGPPGRIDWLPETQPAFPLDARDPVGLLLCLLTSLYGLEYLGRMRNTAGIQHIEEYIDSMCWRGLPPIERYWVVRTGTPENYKELYYQQVALRADDFEDDMRREYPGCAIRGMTKSKFESLNVKKLVYSERIRFR